MQRPLLTFPILLGLLSGCIGWDEYYGTTPTRVQNEGPPNEEMVAISAGRKGAYYLIDRNRRLCFFQHGDALTAVDCEGIEEARDLLQATEPRSHASKRYPQRVRPDQEERTPNPITQPTRTMAPTQSAPSKEEKDAYTRAYTEVLCLSRSNQEFSPREIIAKHGLATKRYTEIEGVLARDRKAWALLTRTARAACSNAALPSTQHPKDSTEETETVDAPPTEE